MKRSEMIIKVAHELGVETEYAEAVLNVVEKFGMLPASFYWSSSGDYSPTSEITEHIFKDAELGRFEWEPEDEE